jgi:hypothetical protein
MSYIDDLAPFEAHISSIVGGALQSAWQSGFWDH